MYLLFQERRLRNSLFLPTTSTCQVALMISAIIFHPSFLRSLQSLTEFGKSFSKFGSQTNHGLCALYLCTCMHTGLQEHFSLQILRIKQPYFQHHATDPHEDNFSPTGTVTALLEAKTCNPAFCSYLEDFSGKSQ